MIKLTWIFTLITCIENVTGKIAEFNEINFNYAYFKTNIECKFQSSGCAMFEHDVPINLEMMHPFQLLYLNI